MNDIRIYDDKNELAHAIAGELLALSLEAEENDLVAHICLSGGTTPKALFELLSHEEIAEEIAWDWLHFWWGDERCVPMDSPESNFGEAFRLLFAHIDFPEEQLHPILGEHDPEDEVIGYAEEMRRVMPLTEEGIPVFDWVLLGLGTDGHTASLFPKGVECESTEIVALSRHPSAGQQRMTITFPVIEAASRVSFLVCGQDKAKVILGIFEGSEESKLWPASRVEDADWWLDEAASSLIPDDEFEEECLDDCDCPKHD